MDLLLNIGQFLLGLLFIVKGADLMTDGASAIAKRFGISTLVIGMTIVAIGSSAPEFVVSALAAIKGNTDMAIGNVVGSNIFNILAIMGATSLMAPVAASKGNIRHDVPFAALSSLVVFFAAFDAFFTPGAENEISRSEGLMMLCMFAIFLAYTMSIAKKEGAQELGNSGTPEIRKDGNSEIREFENSMIREFDDSEIRTSGTPGKQMPLRRSIMYVIIGLAMLISGGDFLVDGASGIASFMGVSQSIIALTIVSMGTSAPELAASMMAAKKGDTAMALGNVVGSVVFNVFFVLGTAATICPLALGNISFFDIATLVGSSALLWFFCKSHSALVKWEGVVMLLVQVAYYVILVLNE